MGKRSDEADQAAAYIAVGKLTAPHGIKGLMRLHPYTEAPETITSLSLRNQTGDASYELSISHAHPKGGLVVAIDGCSSREEAEALRNTELFALRADLFHGETDDDEYYIESLRGLAVYDMHREPLGEIEAIHNFGAGDILEIRPESGAPFMALFTRETIPEIDIEKGYILYSAPEPVEAAEETHEPE